MPASGLRRFLTVLEEALEKNSPEGKLVIIVADQNIDLMKAK